MMVTVDSVIALNKLMKANVPKPLPPSKTKTPHRGGDTILTSNFSVIFTKLDK